MAEQKKTDLEYELADVLIGMPHDFSVGRKHFRIYPVTLAKVFLLGRYMEELKIDRATVKINPYLEALRLAHEKREECCYIIAVHTAPNTYKDLFDRRAIVIRKNFFMKEMDDEDIATMMIYALTWDRTKELSSMLGIDDERKRMHDILAIKKNDKNSMQFGGVSIFGTFIGQLKEMGYSDDEILYEKGYSYLRLMLMDKIVSTYLTDEELGKIPESKGGKMIQADDPQAMEKLKGLLSSRGVRFE